MDLPPPPELPKRINLGSGKSWDPDYLNIDIDAKWRPDLLADLSDSSWIGRTFSCERFGDCRLEADGFEYIVAMDVLEHVPDLTGLMTSCLRLLRPGGVMKIGVPYDLSLGAWQDPTHVRAFNENSWHYYTEWHWYLGWEEARFDLTSQVFLLSAYGQEKNAGGCPLEDLLRMPRAIDSIHVELTKRLLTAEETAAAKEVRRGRV
jgi:SAM-dependent methyltransferase